MTEDAGLRVSFEDAFPRFDDVDGEGVVQPEA
jgi:hypothetical protein